MVAIVDQLDGKAFFQFQVKRGIIDTTDLEQDDHIVVDEIISLCQQSKHELARKKALQAMFFECDFYNLDCDPSEVFVDLEMIEFGCDDSNTSVDVDYYDGNLIMTVSVQFTAQVVSSLCAEEIQEILSDQGGWSCAAISPFMFACDDGTNMWLTQLCNQKIDLDDI